MADDVVMWQRIDAHGKEIQDLKLQQKLGEKALEQHDAEFRRMNRERVDSHNEIMNKIDGISKPLTTVLQDYQRREGAREHAATTSIDFKWSIGTIVAVSMLVIAFYSMN